MDSVSIHLRVRSVSKAEESRFVNDFEHFLRTRTDGVILERCQEIPGAQDPGMVLVAVFSTPAVVSLAKGIADWMQKRNVTVTISPDGKKSLQGPAVHVERVLRAILQAEADAARRKQPN
jgi:hypothetical protein